MGETGLNLVDEIKSDEMGFENVKFNDWEAEIHVYPGLKIYCCSILLDLLFLNAV